MSAKIHVQQRELKQKMKLRGVGEEYMRMRPPGVKKTIRSVLKNVCKTNKTDRIMEKTADEEERDQNGPDTRTTSKQSIPKCFHS
ncbi:hypothetical protein QQ045_008874 [Rhodiola kirilowii]